MKKGKILGVLISIIIAALIMFIGIERQDLFIPNHVYRVYLNGKLLDLLDSESDLRTLIDQEQRAIREEYNVDYVYPPSGLEIVESRTFDNDIKTAEEIYNEICNNYKDSESVNTNECAIPFTVSGFTVTITYPEEESEEQESVTKEPLILYILHKEDFESALRTFVEAFVGTDEFELYINDTQPEIVEEGTLIESIYWLENMTIRPSYISVEEEILTSAADISRYLIFGTLEEQEPFIVKEGEEDIELISRNHRLSPEEFLVANPEISDSTALLRAGQVVNVGLINPLISIIAEYHVVENVIIRFETDYQNNPNAAYGTRETIQEGINGEERITEKIRYRNGEIQQLVISERQELSPAVPQIISRGTRSSSGTGTWTNSGGNENWGWPTNSPSVITSRYGYRWGNFHGAIDITGTGYGSPIRAVAPGVIIRSERHWSWGNYIVIDHQNGYFTLYAHMSALYKSVGQTVNSGDIIGAMGSTGVSTGTHLHLEVKRGNDWNSATYLDPCRSIYSC